MTKLTDEQIIKALECCAAHPREIKCDNCAAYVDSKCTIKTKEILDLINRLKAENNELKRVLNKKFNDFECEYDNKIKTEAIKEFAERLIRNVTMNNTEDGSLILSVDYHCLMDDIQELLKEMVGEG